MEWFHLKNIISEHSRSRLDGVQDLLGAEMSETFAVKKSLAEAELRNEKLARLLGVEEVKNKRLQDSLKR